VSTKSINISPKKGIWQLQNQRKFLASVAGFAGALEPNRRKEENATSLIAASTLKFHPEPTQPQLFSILFI